MTTTLSRADQAWTWLENLTDPEIPVITLRELGILREVRETDDGVVQVFLDLDDMVAGDQLQVRIYEKARSGDTQRVVYEAIITGDQGSTLWASPSLILMHGWSVSADALAGTITVNWSIRRIPVA